MADRVPDDPTEFGAEILDLRRRYEMLGNLEASYLRILDLRRRYETLGNLEANIQAAWRAHDEALSLISAERRALVERARELIGMGLR